jgi:hypothetical protein
MPRDDRGWNDDDRPSWRELDRRRDASRHRRDEKPAFEGSKKQQAGARLAALRQADKAFAKKKDPAQFEAEQELERARNSPGFAEVAQRFFDTYGLTDDWHVRLLLAQAPVSAVALPALEALAEQAAELGTAEKRAIASQLRMLVMTGKAKIKQAAQAALEKY